MKKLIVAVVLVVGLVGCGGPLEDGTDVQGDPAPAGTAQQALETPNLAIDQGATLKTVQTLQDKLAAQNVQPFQDHFIYRVPMGGSGHCGH